MKEKEANICKNLYIELIRKVENSKLTQAHNIIDINEKAYKIGDLARLAILDPITFEFNDVTFFRVSRVVRFRGKTDNYNVNLRDKGFNVFCTWNLDLDEQVYRFYFYGSHVGSQFCPPTAYDLLFMILATSIIDIQIDKRKEFTEFRDFLKDSKKLSDHIKRRKLEKKEGRWSLLPKKKR